MKRLNYAVIGTGRMGSNHIRVLSEIDSINLCSLCDPDSNSLKEASKKYRIDSIYNDVDKLINNENLDAVVIAASTQFHHQIAKRCIESGLNVFIKS